MIRKRWTSIERAYSISPLKNKVGDNKMNYKDEVMKLIYKADEYDRLNQFNLAIPLQEKAVSIASEHDDVIFQMYWRFDLIKSYIFTGDTLKAIIHFSWCVTQMEKGYTNDQVVYQILWEYKYIADEIVRFASVSHKKIEEFFESMKKMYIEENISLHPYYSLRVGACIFGIDTGTDIKEYYKKWLVEPVDEEYEDCNACSLGRKISYYIFLGDYRSALKAAKNIINGTCECSQVPHVPFAELLLPLYSLEEYELADTLQRKGIRLINGDKTFIKEVGRHIMYLSLTNIENGIRVFERNYPNSLKCSIDDMKMWFNMGAFVLFSKLKEKDIEKIKIKIPKDSPIYSTKGYNVSDLREFFKKETIKLIDAFDHRNGNHVVSDYLQRHLDICDCVLK